MKLLDKLIYEVDEARNEFYLEEYEKYDEMFRSFYSFIQDVYDFEQDINELTDISDKYTYLKYLINDVLNELNKCEIGLSNIEYVLKVKQFPVYPNTYSKKDIELANKKYKEETKQDKKYYIECVKNLNVLLKFLNNELNEVLKFNTKHNNFFGFEGENSEPKQNEQLKSQYRESNIKSNKETKQQIESLQIKWLINDSELYYLMAKLEFPEPKKSILIQFVKDNFIDRHNKPFANKFITQGINNLYENKSHKGKSKNSNDIDKIMKESLSNGVLNFNKLIENLLIKNYFRESDKNKLKKLTNIIN